MTTTPHREDLIMACSFLRGMACRLDSLVTDSLSEEWSTPQAKKNREAADDCRRFAAGLDPRGKAK